MWPGRIRVAGVLCLQDKVMLNVYMLLLVLSPYQIFKDFVLLHRKHNVSRMYTNTSILFIFIIAGCS